MRSSNVRAALVLVLTFAAGAAAGIAADRMWLDRGEPTIVGGAASDSSRAGGDEEKEHRRDRPRTTIEKFADELELTREQRARIEEILSRHREEMHEMWEKIRPRFRTLMDSARADIEAVLTPEQVEQYRKYLRREHEGFEAGDPHPEPDSGARGDTSGKTGETGDTADTGDTSGGG